MLVVTQRITISTEQELVLDDVIKRISESVDESNNKLVLHSKEMFIDGHIRMLFWFNLAKSSFVLLSDREYRQDPDYIKILRQEFAETCHINDISYDAELKHFSVDVASPSTGMSPQLMATIRVDTVICK